MAAILLAVMLIVTLGPDTTRQTVLSKKMHGVPEVFVTSPTLLNATVFSRTFGHWACSAKALESLSITIESLAVIADFGEQAWSDLGSGARQMRSKNIQAETLVQSSKASRAAGYILPRHGAVAE